MDNSKNPFGYEIKLRTLSEVLKEADKATCHTDILRLWNEIANNKHSYPVIELDFAEEYLKEICVKKNLPNILTSYCIAGEKAGEIIKGNPLDSYFITKAIDNIDEQIRKANEYNLDAVANAFGVPSNLLNKPVKSGTFKPKKFKYKVLKFVLNLINRLFGNEFNYVIPNMYEDEEI